MCRHFWQWRAGCHACWHSSWLLYLATCPPLPCVLALQLSGDRGVALAGGWQAGLIFTI